MLTSLDMNRALTPLLLNHVVLLAWPAFKGRPPETQTGFLASYRGHHLVVTAGHGLEPQATFPRPMGVITARKRFGPLGKHGQFGMFKGASDKRKTFPPPWGTGEVPDLGFVVVDPSHFSELGLEFIDLDQQPKGWQYNKRHVAAGWPGEFLKAIPPKLEKAALHLTGGAYLLITDHRDEHHVPQEPRPMHFSLKYRTRGEHRAPAAFGLSGSPVWELEDDATPEDPRCHLTGLIYGVADELSAEAANREMMHCLRIFVLTDVLDEMARDGRLEEFLKLDRADGETPA